MVFLLNLQKLGRQETLRSHKNHTLAYLTDLLDQCQIPIQEAIKI